MPVGLSGWFPNEISAWLFIILFFSWAGSELVNSIWGGRSWKSGKDRGSYWIIALIVYGSIAISIETRIRNIGVFLNEFQVIGLGMLFAGIGLREWAVITLGKFFKIRVTIEKNHRLITGGPYRWIRHPAYTGSIITLVGFPLALGTWVGAVLVLLFSIAAYLYRVRVEEQALLTALGDEYQDYMQRTWMLFPGF